MATTVAVEHAAKIDALTLSARSSWPQRAQSSGSAASARHEPIASPLADSRLSMRRSATPTDSPRTMIVSV